MSSYEVPLRIKIKIEREPELWFLRVVRGKGESVSATETFPIGKQGLLPTTIARIPSAPPLLYLKLLLLPNLLLLTVLVDNYLVPPTFKKIP